MLDYVELRDPDSSTSVSLAFEPRSIYISIMTPDSSSNAPSSSPKTPNPIQNSQKTKPTQNSYNYKTQKHVSFSPTVSLISPTTFPSSISDSASLSTHPIFKYKKVADKVRPVAHQLPERFQIVRIPHPHPLKGMPVLPKTDITVVPTPRFTQERIDAFPIHESIWPKERLLILWLVAAHSEAFAWTEEERGTFLYDFFPPVHIPTLDHIPWVEKNIPIPPALLPQVIEILREKQRVGVIEPTNSPYRGRWFCVVKKDGKSLRLVHDLQPLNAVSIRDPTVPYPPEHIAETFGGCPLYATLDLKVGFDHRKLHVDSRDMTAFQTPIGPFRLTVLPQGYTNSPQVLHGDVVSILIDEIPHNCFPFIDDVPCKSDKWDGKDSEGNWVTLPENDGIRLFVYNFLVMLNRVIQRIRVVGGTFSGSKSFIAFPEANILGHICNINGRIPDPSYVDRITNWGDLKDVKDVRAFNGVVGVLRHFIPDLARIQYPLNRLLVKNRKFEFGEVERRAQQAVKEAVLKCGAVKAIDYQCGRKVIFAVDTSVIGYGAILMQEGEDGRRYPARFGSRAWIGPVKNYSQPKLELYGLFSALYDHRVFLSGLPNFTVEVDARYIKGMINHPDVQPNATINRWIAGILLFRFDLVHVPATKHTGPDGLSRRHPQPLDPEVPDPTDAQEEFVDTHYNFVSELPIDEQSYDLVPRSKTARRKDLRLVDIKTYLDTLQLPDYINDSNRRSFINRAAMFFVRNSELYKKARGTRPHQLVVPPERRFRLLHQGHDLLGHKGFVTVQHHILSRFWWPNVGEDIKWYLKSCSECQARQFTHPRIPPTVAVPARLFQKVYMDVMKLPQSSGYSCIVQARCSLSGWPEWRALTSESSQTVAKFFFEEVVCRWGAVPEVVTDNGSSFLGEFRKLATRFQIHQIRISPYNSKANGIVERRHRDVREALMKTAVSPDKWMAVAHYVFMAERFTVQKATNYSPYFIVHGVEPTLPFDLLEFSFNHPTLIGKVSTSDLLAARAKALLRRSEDLARIRKQVHAARLRSADSFSKHFSNTIFSYDFQPRALVLARHVAIETSHSRKQLPRFLGPYVVVRRTKGGSYILAELDGAIHANRYAATRLIPYYSRTFASNSIPEITSFSDSQLDDLAAQHSQVEQEEMEKDQASDSSDSSSPHHSDDEP